MTDQTQAPHRAASLRTDYIRELTMCAEVTKREEIGQLLIDLLDATEQSEVGDLVIAAERAYRGEREPASASEIKRIADVLAGEVHTLTRRKLDTARADAERMNSTIESLRTELAELRRSKLSIETLADPVSNCLRIMVNGDSVASIVMHTYAGKHIAELPQPWTWDTRGEEWAAVIIGEDGKREAWCEYVGNGTTAGLHAPPEVQALVRQRNGWRG